ESVHRMLRQWTPMTCGEFTKELSPANTSVEIVGALDSKAIMGDLSRPAVISKISSEYTTGITLCIPAFNEEITIEQVIMDADTALRQASLPGEILVIDDCSTDRTWDILCNIQKTLPLLQIRRHPENKGIALTFAELYQWAKKGLVFLNSADGQWKMGTVLELLPLAEQYDIIVALRREKHYGPGRQFVSWLFNVLPPIIFATPTYDAGSVKLVRREVYDIPIISSGVFGEAERIIRAQRRGFRIGVKEIEHFPRRSGKASGAKLSLIIEAALDMLRCWFDIVVLRRT
ncbi:MAG: glycosyltransferase family 2 protein, partial [Acidobacteriota bacterium]